ncbi:MAG: hypothetical protein H3C62_09515 [Gemmatimonadaceae bacterium]|nr:hypothetical protein [Gemmatimonadaceae bacterium]
MPDPNSRPPSALADHAAGQIAFIRDTMMRAGRFTAVSGTGTIGAGVIGGIAAVLAPRMPSPLAWLQLWLGAAVIAVPVAFVLMARKAGRSGQSLRTGPGRTFALAFAPPLLAGAVLTGALVRAELWALLPGVWLVCYGAGIVSGGAFSVRAVPAMGVVLMLLGTVAFFVPVAAQAWLLGAGFGVTHLVFGFYIARYHGG